MTELRYVLVVHPDDVEAVAAEVAAKGLDHPVLAGHGVVRGARWLAREDVLPDDVRRAVFAPPLNPLLTEWLLGPPMAGGLIECPRCGSEIEMVEVFTLGGNVPVFRNPVTACCPPPPTPVQLRRRAEDDWLESQRRLAVEP